MAFNWFPNSSPTFASSDNEDLIKLKWWQSIYRFCVGSTRTCNTIYTSDFTAGNDFYYAIDCSGGDVTVTLPLAATYNYKQYVFQKINSSNILFVQRSGSDLINGGTNTTVTSSYNTIKVISNAVSTWYKI